MQDTRFIPAPELDLSIQQMKIIHEIISQNPEDLTDRIYISKEHSIPAYKIDIEQYVTGDRKDKFIEKIKDLVGKKVSYEFIEPETNKSRKIFLVPFVSYEIIEDTPYIKLAINPNFVSIIRQQEIQIPKFLIYSVYSRN